VKDGADQVTQLREGPDRVRIDALLNAKLLRTQPLASTNHLASGSFVVASKLFAEFIREANADIHAGEMEAAGMMAAAEYQRKQVDTLVVRGISDHVDANKSEVDAVGEGALRRLAMANAWRLVCTLMRLGLLRRSNTQAKPAATPPPSGALTMWQRKLAYLLEQEPITVDPDAKFRLHSLIEEARAKLREPGGEA
jgi:hypothetical protein